MSNPTSFNTQSWIDNDGQTTMSGTQIRTKAANLISSGANFLATRDWQGMAVSIKNKVATSQSSIYASSRNSIHTQSSLHTAAFSASSSNQQATTLKPQPLAQQIPVLLPGWVQRKLPCTTDTSDLDILVHGFVSKMLDTPTKSQKVFNQMARQLAALPRLPYSQPPYHFLDNQNPLNDEPEQLACIYPNSSTLSDECNGSASAETLTNTQGQEEIDRMIKDLNLTSSAFNQPEPPLVQGFQPLAAFTHFESKHGPQDSMDSTSPNVSTRPRTTSSYAPSTISLSGGSLFWSNRTLDDVHILHQNLNQRLSNYWSYRSPNRILHIQVVPIINGKPVCGLDGTPLLLATTRLTTDSTGQFRHRLIIPYQRISGFCSHYSSLTHITPEMIEALEIRALLQPDQTDPVSCPETASTSSDGPIAKPVSTAWVRHSIQNDAKNVVHVISDIDDTVKHTGVLEGAKHILRNVFVLPFHECEIPGIAKWYQAMIKHNVGLHYVTNAPLELHKLVQEYLAAVQLPISHLTLKNYPTGTRNLIASWFQPAAERKRANVVSVLDDFRQSPFILIGDSGELDLELYCALAAERPWQIRAIYIRDVSSPRPGTNGFSPFNPAQTNTDSKPDSSTTLYSNSDSLGFFEPSYPSNSASATLSSAKPKARCDSIDTFSETDIRRKQAFQARLIRATNMIPRSTQFKLFWDGSDIEAHALQLIRELQNA